MSEDLQPAAAKSASRRTVLKAAVWAAPIVAVAAAAPLAAASTTPAPRVDGATITASNFGPTERGAVIGLVDSDFNPIAFPGGSTISLTVTGTGSLTVTRVVNGAFSPAVTELTAGTYTLNPNGGALNVNFRGPVTGSITVQAAITYPDGNGNFPMVQTSQAVISA